MPETLIGTSLKYYLIAFDANGKERENNGELISQKVIDILSSASKSQQPITDVFFMSHGWLGDIPGAKIQYDEWIAAMGKNQADIKKMQQVRPGFRPLLIALHWPSKPWGDEDLNAVSPDKTIVSFDSTDNSQEELIEQYAQDVADTEAAREALRTIFAAATEYSIAPETLPPEVSQAYEQLIKEASLDNNEDDSESLDLNPDTIYQALLAEEETQEVSFGIGDAPKNKFLELLGYLSYWQMKKRARDIGETSGFNLLNKLQKAATETTRFHLIGHSFGCIVVSAIVAGKKDSQLVRPINSLVLIQGALSLWSYSFNIPRRASLAGCFSSIINDRKVVGPIVTTRSIHDNSVTKLYPIASRPGNWFMGQDIDFSVGTESEFPEYGSIGTFGIQGMDETISLKMLPCEKLYSFKPGKVYNLESSEFIRNVINEKDEDAHNSIAQPEVAHAVWSAALGK
jgi:hypothetical protein